MTVCEKERKKNFDILKIILKLKVSAEPLKRFGIIEVHTFGKLSVETWAQNIT